MMIVIDKLNLKRDADRRDPQVSCGTEPIGPAEPHSPRSCLAFRAEMAPVLVKDRLYECLAAKCQAVPEVTDTATQKIR